MIGAQPLPFVSIVIPVKNGVGRLEHCVKSLKQQDYPSDRFEIIVADGRSKDSTIVVAKHYGCIVIDNPRETVAGGRNVGVAIAKGDYIAFSEDDMILPPNWLSAGVHLLSDQAIDAVGGPTPIPLASKSFSKSVDLIFRIAANTGYSVQSGLETAVRRVNDIPGGNAIYKRTMFAEDGAMDETYITGEDVDFHLRLKQRGFNLVFAPTFFSWHYKRDSPSKFFKQIRRFAQGRVQLWRQHPGAMRTLHWLAAAVVPCVLALDAITGYGVAGVSAAIGLVSLVTIGTFAARSIKVGLWFSMTTTIFFTAWSWGVLRELVLPTRDATGK